MDLVEINKTIVVIVGFLRIGKTTEGF